MICGIKEKAKNLIGGGFVTRAFSGNKSRFVKSSSSKKPHLVQTHKTLDTRVMNRVCNTRRTKFVLTLSRRHMTTTS